MKRILTTGIVLFALCLGAQSAPREPEKQQKTQKKEACAGIIIRLPDGRIIYIR